MITVEMKLIQLLEAKTNAVDEYNHVVHAYLLKRGTNSDELFETELRRSLTHDEIANSPDTDPFSPEEVLTGLNHLIEQQRVELVIVDGHVEYAYKRL